MQSNYDEIIAKMTLQQKAALCSGADMWHFKGFPELNIPAIMVTDGPHGLRKQDSTQGVAIDKAVPATCFPTAATTACSWDTELLSLLGTTIAEEAACEQVAVVLGPGTNIKRSPLCGRNFEYFSEDPYLSGKLSAAFIRGVQEKGIGTSLKHFCANNQETFRQSINAVVDERTLRELYLLPFEIAIKESHPTTVMASYNKVNGTYVSQHRRLLHEILRDEWGFDGMVISDWGAVASRVPALQAGMDMEMPSSGGMNDEKIVQAVQDGTLDEAVLDTAVRRILRCIDTTYPAAAKGGRYSHAAHDAIARKIATRSAVLLRNAQDSLPLRAGERILVVGEMAKLPRYQGAGSSFICATHVTNLLDGLTENGVVYDYLPGYYTDKPSKNKKALADVLRAANRYDRIICCVGLPAAYEAEGFDRTSIELPPEHNELIERLADVHSNITVVLSMGSVVRMPWANRVRAILCMYLGGQAAGGACADLLTGKETPCGKLAETFPLLTNDTPSAAYFPGNRRDVEYREGLYVGYRYYDTARAAVQFPFGFGLSYTTFAYSDMQLSASDIRDDQTLRVQVTVRNTGEVRGREIVQLYVHDCDSSIYMPEQQLKGFTVVELQPNESKTVEFELDRRSFAFYDTDTADWQVESGAFEIRIGASSRDIRARATVNVTACNPVTVRPTPQGWYTQPDLTPIPDQAFRSLIPDYEPSPVVLPRKGEFTTEDSFCDMAQSSGLARVTLKLAKVGTRIAMHASKDDPNCRMIYEVFRTAPVRALSTSSQGMFNEKMANSLVDMMNGHFFRGLGGIFSGMRKPKESKDDKKKS